MYIGFRQIGTAMVISSQLPKMSNNRENAFTPGNGLLIIFQTFDLNPFVNIFFINIRHVEKIQRPQWQNGDRPFGDSDYFF